MIMVGKKTPSQVLDDGTVIRWLLHWHPTSRRTMYWGDNYRQLLCLDIHPSTRYQVTNSRGIEIEVVVSVQTDKTLLRDAFGSLTPPCTDYQAHCAP
jgi:hypothetical protein